MRPIFWTPGTGLVTIALQSGQLFGHSVKLTCTANASTGAFTIPAALTQHLLPTAAGSLQISNATETTVTPSGWTIQASASTAQARSLTVLP